VDIAVVSSPRTPLTIDDLYDLGWIEDVRVSPDSRHVAFVQVVVDRAQNRYRRTIWLAPTAGGPPRRFTAGPSDRQPRWSPDGARLAFVAARADEPEQIFVIRADGGEAQPLTAMPNGASDPAWSPDGARIAFLASVSEEERRREDAGEQPPLPADDWEARRRREERRRAEERRGDPRVVTKLPYRSGTSFFDDRRRHIYLVDVPAADIDPPLPRARRLSDGDIHHAAPAWMPDGHSLLTTATRDPEADSLFAYYDVLRVPVDGGQPAPITTPGFSYFDPRPSPDGTQIAFLRFSEERILADGSRVAIIPAGGGEPHDLTAHTDLNVETFRWQPDGAGVLFCAGWQGDAHVYAIGLPGTPTYQRGGTLVGGRRIVAEFDVGADGTIAFVAGWPENPCELFVRAPDGAERQLTRVNARLLDGRAIAPIEELRYSAPDGQEVQGWVLYPPDFQEGRQYPLAIHIHGGPHTMWGPGFRSMWHEWQVGAASGYIVFFCNPRGSDGYGERWRDAIHGRWGAADADDIHTGIDVLLARGHVDPARIAVTGGSYGGFMTTWLIGHSDRFACAVAARGVYNLLTQHSTSDAHELIEIEFDGYPWELHEELWEHSPLAHAHKITAPLLLLHSELDFRVPISEAEQLFAILRRQKKVVELVRYPREGHELTRSGEPDHRADHMRRTLAWFDRFCRTS